jgi:hypothetical protein
MATIRFGANLSIVIYFRTNEFNQSANKNRHILGLYDIVLHEYNIKGDGVRHNRLYG